MQKQTFLKKFKLSSGQLNVAHDENLKDLNTKNNLLLHLMHELAKAKSKERLFSLTTNYSLKIFGAEVCAIYFPNETKRKLTAAYISSSEAAQKGIAEINLIRQLPLNSDYPLSRSFRKKKVLTAASEIPVSLKKVGIKSGIFFPVLLKEEALGVFALFSNRRTSFSSEDIKIGELIGLHLGLKMHNQDLLSSVKVQNETLELLQNRVGEGLALHGPDGVIYYANRAISHFFGNTASTIGLRREELIGNWDKYHKYKATRLYDIEEMKKTVYEDKKPFLGGLMIIHSNPPKVIEANYYPVIKDGNFAGMAAAYRDVTKERKQEQDLATNFKRIQKERDRWNAVFSNVDEAVCLIDREFKITHMNSTCENFSGMGLRQVLGQNYYKVFKCHTGNGLYYPDFNPLEKILITKEPIPYEEYLHTNASSEDVWVGVSASPIKDASSEIQEIVLVIRDINSVKEIEKAKSQFVSVASHELRTPLTVINGYLSLLINGDLGDFSDSQSRQQLREVLNKVYNETERLTDLVSDLLNVSRIEEKRVQLNRKEYLLKEVIDEVVEELGYVAFQKKVNLRVERTNKEAKTTAFFDKSKIYEVLLNLVDNSLKFTNPGGEVVLTYWQEDEKVYVAVKDNGVGIPKKLQSIIFEKFQQVPGSYLKENRGTGLGLFIVKSLVELHKGHLEVWSEPGKGSKFTFSLPRKFA